MAKQNVELSAQVDVSTSGTQNLQKTIEQLEKLKKETKEKIEIFKWDKNAVQSFEKDLRDFEKQINDTKKKISSNKIQAMQLFDFGVSDAQKVKDFASNTAKFLKNPLSFTRESLSKKDSDTFADFEKKRESLIKRYSVASSDEEKASLLAEGETLKKDYGSFATKSLIGQTMLGAAEGFTNIVKSGSKFINDTFNKTLGISLNIKDVFNDILTTAGQMLTDMTTSDFTSSLITNSAARERQLKYGFTGAESFAFSQLSGLLGVSSDEDLMYMNSQQKQLYLSMMDKYTSWYEEMSSDGTLASIQQLQLDFSIFKQEIAMDFLNWIAEKKETLFNVINLGVTVLEGIFEVIGWIADLIPGMSTSYDKLSDYSSSSTTINITATATGNSTDSGSLQTQLDSWSSTIAKEVALAVKK